MVSPGTARTSLDVKAGLAGPHLDRVALTAFGHQNPSGRSEAGNRAHLAAPPTVTINRRFHALAAARGTPRVRPGAGVVLERGPPPPFLAVGKRRCGGRDGSGRCRRGWRHRGFGRRFRDHCPGAFTGGTSLRTRRRFGREREGGPAEGGHRGDQSAVQPLVCVAVQHALLGRVGHCYGDDDPARGQA